MHLLECLDEWILYAILVDEALHDAYHRIPGFDPFGKTLFVSGGDKNIKSVSVRYDHLSLPIVFLSRAVQCH
jgi:hypothetical protein